MTPQIVFLYANEDAQHLTNIKNSIRIFKDQQLLDYWDETMLMAGEHRAIIEQKISASDIIIPLLSADFLADDTCNKYLNLAVTKGKYLLPIVVRACQWKYYPVLKDTEPAPKQDREVVPVTDTRWNPIADAYDTIATNVIAVVEKLQLQNSKTNLSTKTNNRDMPTQNVTFDNGYALLIGIAYKYWAIGHGQLGGTLNDVSDLQAHFTNPKKAAYKPENVIALTEEKATKQGILDALDDLACKVENDSDASVIISYSGHGLSDGLVPYDYQRMGVLPSKEFSEKVAAIKAKKLLLILDCCHSENLATTKDIGTRSTLDGLLADLDSSLGNSQASTKGLIDEVVKGTGRVILTSCESNETSLDMGGNGLFTKVLLECLNGTNNIEKDGRVRLIDLMRYVPKTVKERAVKEYVKGKWHQQNPMFKRIEDLSSEEFIVCSYDIAIAKGFEQDDRITQPTPQTTTQPPINQPIPNIAAIRNAYNQADYATVIELLDKYFGQNPTPQYSTLKQTIENYLNQGLMPPPATLQGLKMLINNLKKQ